MSKLDDLLPKFAADVESAGEKVDKKLLRAVAKGCGPSIYKADSALVASKDKKEVATLKKNFCIKKLGVKDTPKLDENILAVFAAYKKPRKLRAVVYYLLVKKLKKASVYK